MALFSDLNHFPFMQHHKVQITRSKFRTDEDHVLRQLVERFGTNSWSEIACVMPGRNSRQCRDRWKHYLSGQSTNYWTPEEDKMLTEKVQQFGMKWTRISTFFLNRTDFDVKTRWFQIFRQKARVIRDLSPPHVARRDRDSQPESPRTNSPTQENQHGGQSHRTQFPSLVVDPISEEHFLKALHGSLLDSPVFSSAMDSGLQSHRQGFQPYTFNPLFHPCFQGTAVKGVLE
jgi:hypothetical protein